MPGLYDCLLHEISPNEIQPRLLHFARTVCLHSRLGRGRLRVLGARQEAGVETRRGLVLVVFILVHFGCGGWRTGSEADSLLR
jgi:hypothetical protein